MSQTSRFLATLASIALIVVGSAAIALGWWLLQPLPLPVSPFAFDVKPGATLKSVARELVGAGVLRFELPLVALARIRQVDRSIKAGNYEIAAGITLPRLLAKLTQGDVTQIALTVVEGSTFAELAAAIATNPAIVKTVLARPEAELAQRIGVSGTNPEGWFFPDTYFITKGSSDLALFVRAHRLMRQRLDAAWARRAGDSPLKDPYSALILASIVEKETARVSDRPLIASVFVNRLRLGMRLQSDPTVIYGLGARFDGNLRKRDLEEDTPYNTYTRDGLPPTPIGLPGQASLNAAVDPPKTDFLYFVARGDGTSEFSANLTDHNRAVARFQSGRR
ncbi:MAG: endolytic transglycosylase MltG [Casimicrobiaceae bacterium]